MIWQQLLALAVLSIGNAELFITLVNRIHALALPERVLQHVRHVHDCLLPLFPLWLVVVVGLTSPATLLHPRPMADIWHDLHPFVRIWFVICTGGFAGFIWSVIRHWRYRPPARQTHFESRRIDLAEQLQEPPVADGPFRGMVGFPGNECFQLEINRRTFRLDRLPPALDGLSILHLTDLHMLGTITRPWFEAVIDQVADGDYDLVVCTGDILDRQDCLDWLPSTLGRLTGSLGQYFILGNHDWYLDTPGIRQAMLELGWCDVGSTLQLLDLGGTKLAIGGSERPWMGKHPQFGAIPDHVFRILLSHTPDNLSWARRQHVDLMLSGHNHGGQVALPVVGPVYSPSVYGCRFAGGVYWQTPTLLYVCRGLSGRHPLRIGACPEVSHLILTR